MHEKNMKNQLIKNIALSLSAALIFLFLLESVQRIRYAAKYHTAYWLFYGFTPKPDKTEYYMLQLKGVHGIKEGGVVKIPRIFYDGYSKFNPDYPHMGYIVNSLGFRGEEFTPKKKKGTFRIGMIGDSTIFCLDVKEDEAFPYLLEKKLHAYLPGEHIEVVNFGIPSYTTLEMKNLVKSEIFGYQPDLLIIQGFFNDIYYSDLVFKKSSHLLSLMNTFLLDHSVFYLSLREKLCKILEKDIGMLYRGSLETLKENLMEDSSIQESIRDNLVEIISESGKKGIPVIILKQAFYPGDKNITKKYMLINNDLKPYYSRIYSTLDTLEQEGRAHVVSVNYAFDNLSGSEKDELFLDGVHLSARGNRLLSDIVFEDIKEYLPAGKHSFRD